MPTPSKLIFFSLSATGLGISGGDRIWIEFARYWSRRVPVAVYTSAAGQRMMADFQLHASPHLTVINPIKYLSQSFLLDYLFKIYTAVITAFRVHLTNPAIYTIYSSSEFWMDSLPGLILKLRHPQLCWVASWYQTAPSPLRGYGSGRDFFSSFSYWLAQLPIKPLISSYADYVFVNNEEEKKHFLNHDRLGKAIVVYGAVAVDKIKAYLRIHHQPLSRTHHQAVFQGRFHPQKGILKLLDIWKMVISVLPDAKLVMIGDGPLMPELKTKINQLGLESNIILPGFIFEGPKKYAYFSTSQIVLHPSIYDSGGMASAEAMAFGMPGIAFDLPSYTSYYRTGLVKVPVGDIEAFSQQIIDLLTHPGKRTSLGKQAQKMVFTNFSWADRANQILNAIT